MMLQMCYSVLLEVEGSAVNMHWEPLRDFYHSLLQLSLPILDFNVKAGTAILDYSDCQTHYFYSEDKLQLTSEEQVQDLCE